MVYGAKSFAPKCHVVSIGLCPIGFSQGIDSCNLGLLIKTCALCNAASETNEHLFFSCEFSSYIWTLCKLKLGLISSGQTLHDEANLIRTKFPSKKKLSALAKLTL